VLRLYWIGKSIRCFFGLMLLILMHLLCKHTCLMYSSSVGWIKTPLNLLPLLWVALLLLNFSNNKKFLVFFSQCFQS
jgi:hypothetical protein